VRYMRFDANGEMGEIVSKRPLDPAQIRRHPDGSMALRPVTLQTPANPESELFEFTVSVFTPEQDKVVESRQLTFKPLARKIMFDMVDKYAEYLRGLIMHSRAGHVLELDLAHQEAQAVAERMPTDIFLKGEYPHLEADVGNTNNPVTDTPVQTIREAATVVRNKRDKASRGLAHLRLLRLTGKRLVRDAATDNDAWEAMKAIPWTVYTPEMYILGRSGYSEP
jgi:hypothetical protein